MGREIWKHDVKNKRSPKNEKSHYSPSHCFKPDILKTVGNHTVDGSHWPNTVEDNGYRQLFGYQHSSENLLLGFEVFGFFEQYEQYLIF